MKSRDFLLSRQSAFCAGFLLVLSLFSAGTIFAASTAPGNPFTGERASMRQRPIDFSQVNVGREPGSRHPAHPTLPSAQSSLAGTSVIDNPARSQSEFDRFVDSVRNGQVGVVRGVYVPGVL